MSEARPAPGRRGLLLSLAALPLARAATAADFPARPLRAVVPFPAGGSTDIVLRLVGPGAERSLGQAIMVDNRGGAGGSVGTALAARAAPDGYTLLVTASTHAINPAVYRNLPYDPVRDFAPVARLASSPFVLVVPASLPITDLPGLLALARQRAGQLSYASPGSGSANHLGMELLKAQAGVDILHVPYSGSAPANTALLAGEVSMMLSPAVVAMPFIQSGHLRALGVSGPEPSPTLPGVPPVASVLPGFDATTWYGVLAPAGTPEPVIVRLNAAFLAGLADPRARERLLAQGVEPAPTSSAEFGRIIAAEVAKWGRVARAAQVRAE